MARPNASVCRRRDRRFGQCCRHRTVLSRDDPAPRGCGTLCAEAGTGWALFAGWTGQKSGSGWDHSAGSSEVSLQVVPDTGGSVARYRLRRPPFRVPLPAPLPTPPHLPEPVLKAWATPRARRQALCRKLHRIPQHSGALPLDLQWFPGTVGVLRGALETNARVRTRS